MSAAVGARGPLTLHGRRGLTAAAVVLALTLALAVGGRTGRPLPTAATAISVPPLLVALTRQRGENEKLRLAFAKVAAAGGIPSSAVKCMEVPCIEHAPGPDYAGLGAHLASLEQLANAIVLTSPEAARVFLNAWRSAGGLAGPPPPLPPVACVGKGTAVELEQAGLSVAFQPSSANAETLAAELPLEEFGPSVLYPASAIAPGTLQEGLEARGFKVKRLDTYTTQGVEEPSPEMREVMASTGVVTFGSPSAVRAWTRSSENRPACACIGSTSRDAAEAAGFGQVYSPSQPGVDGWAESTVAAVRAMLEN